MRRPAGLALAVGWRASQRTQAAPVDELGNPINASGPGDDTTAGVKSVPTTRVDAARLLQQATFGPRPDIVARVAADGPRKYLLEQFATPASRYRYVLAQNAHRDQIHSAASQDFCSRFGQGSGERENCWRDWFSTMPVQWDFFRQAIGNDDQLRQRVAFVLGQIFVTSAYEVSGSYGFAEYHQMLRDNAFGNFRELLRKVTLSPLMGTYLNMVNNDGADPNENYARELLQLFSLGPCLLEPDGRLRGGQCEPAYDNAMVRNYAYALSGWTYPVGGINPWCDNCNDWTHPEYLRGDMVPVSGRHDQQVRALLSGVVAPAGRSAEQGLAAVLDSIMAHPNLPPFIAYRMIQFLVTSNPSPQYVARVAAAFAAGRHADAGGTIGSGVRGDMQALIAAVLLDAEARDPAVAMHPDYGRLREPVLYMTGAIRALSGRSDGEWLGLYGWGSALGQPVFNAPSVFNFYPADFPVTGTDLVGPQFGIDNVNTGLERINFANALVYWWYNRNQGTDPDPTIPGAQGTRLDYAGLESLLAGAQDSARVVDELNLLLADGRLTHAERQVIVTAMNQWTPAQDNWLTRPDQASNYRRERIKTALYLVLASPQYQVQR
ncbi:MAG: DUF1800 domain-containing protein [Burkholderiaceae bacterium]